MKENTFIEEAVVKAFKEGDVSAFRTLYEEFAPRLQGFAARFRLSKDETDEVVQETFIRLWKHREHFNPSSSFSTYIITIAKHLIYNQIKREGYKEKYIKELAFRTAPGNSAVQSEWELRQLLDKAVLELPERCRLVFQKSRLEGASNQQIADELGISKSTVENQLNKALKLVRRFLRAAGYGG